MRKAVFLGVLLLATIGMSAKSMKDLWISMPDSIIPYLNKSLRIELVDFINMKVDSEVKNLFNENTVMDTITADYALVSLSKSSKVELKLLPRNVGDSVICMIRTYLGTSPESVVSLYTQDWTRLDASQLFDGEDMESVRKTLVSCPDTMSTSRYEELLKYIDPGMASASLCQDSNVITFNLSLPMLSEKERATFAPILLQRRFKWNGVVFKKVID